MEPVFVMEPGPPKALLANSLCGAVGAIGMALIVVTRKGLWTPRWGTHCCEVGEAAARVADSLESLSDAGDWIGRFSPWHATALLLGVASLDGAIPSAEWLCADFDSRVLDVCSGEATVPALDVGLQTIIEPLDNELRFFGVHGRTTRLLGMELGDLVEPQLSVPSPWADAHLGH